MKLHNLIRPDGGLSSRWAQPQNFLFVFLILDTVPSNSTQKISPTFDKLNEIKFETVRIFFLSDVFICCHPEILLPWQRDATTFFSIMRLCSPLNLKNSLWMAKSQPGVKPTCLPSITSNAEKNELWNTDRLTSFTRQNYNPFQSSSSLPICASFVSAVLFIHSFHVLISYFLFSLSFVAVSTVWFLLNTFCMTQLL